MVLASHERALLPLRFPDVSFCLSYADTLMPMFRLLASDAVKVSANRPWVLRHVVAYCRLKRFFIIICQQLTSDESADAV